MVGARFESESSTVLAKARVIFDEVLLGHTHEGREIRCFIIRKADLARPAATGCASLALEIEFHAQDWFATKQNNDDQAGVQ